MLDGKTYALQGAVGEMATLLQAPGSILPWGGIFWVLSPCWH